MPGTSHRVLDHQPFRQRSAVVGAGGTDREELVAAARDEYGFLADVPCEHASVEQIIDGNTPRQVGTGWLRSICAHCDLRMATLPRGIHVR